MFNSYLDFTALGSFKSEDTNIKKVFKYRFKTLKNNYLVDVDLFNYDIFILKFYLKNHRNSPDRFSFRTHEGVAIEVLGTCLWIAFSLYEKYPLASFGFVGGNDIGENKENNKRYRVYKSISTRYFSEEKFNHFRDDKNSLYLIFNKDNKHLHQEKIIKEISAHYDVYL